MSNALTGKNGKYVKYKIGKIEQKKETYNVDMRQSLFVVKDEEDRRHQDHSGFGPPSTSLHLGFFVYWIS